MASEIASAYVTILPSARGIGSKLSSQISGEMATAGTTAGTKMASGMRSSLASKAKYVVGPLLGAFAAIKVADFLKDSVAQARESQKVGALTTQVIKSTGGAAQVTAGQVADLANAISLKTGIDDEAIQSGENMLLTFKNIRNEVGAGNDIFDQSVQILTDVSSVMGTDAKSAAIQLGKALNDPAKGISALTRIGVTFTDQQIKQVTALVDSNRTLEAQKIILGELKSEFGGAAEAQATMGEKASVAWQNIEEQLGTALLPLIDEVEKAFIEKAVPALQELIDKFQKDGVPALREFGGYLVSDVVPAVESFGGFVKNDLLPPLASLAKLVIAAVQAFSGLPSPLKSAAAQAAVLAVVASKLAPAFQAAQASIGKSATSMGVSTAKMAAMRGGALLLGGALLALGDKAGESNKAVGTALDTLGGAAIGATFGPWGAAIGGAIGFVKGLTTALGSSDDAMANLAVATTDYRTSLNQLTGAVTRQTAAQVRAALIQDGVLQTARQYGLNLQDVTKAAEGNAGATRRVNAAVAEQRARYSALITEQEHLLTIGKGDREAHAANIDAYKAEVKALDDFQAKLGVSSAALKAQRDEIELNRAAAGKTTLSIQAYNDAMDALPKNVQTAIKALGIDATRADVDNLVKHYNLTPTQKSTVMQVVGIPYSLTLLDAFSSHIAAIPTSKVTTIYTRFVSEVNPFGGTPHGLGGTITGGIAGKDSVPIVGMPGEEIIRTSQARRWRPLLKAINAGAAGFAGGGTVSGGSASDTNWNAILKALSGFGLGRRESGSSLMSEFRALARTMRQELGKDAPLLKGLLSHLDAVKRQTHALDDTRDHLGNLTDRLKSVEAAERSFTSSALSAAGLNDPFAQGNSLAQSTLGLRANTNDLRAQTAAIRHANQLGLSDAAFKFILASGDASMLAGISKSEVHRLNRLVREQNKASAQFRRASGKAAGFDAREAALHHDIRATNRQVGRLVKALAHLDKRIENAVERGARDGTATQTKSRQRDGHRHARTGS